jgi:hypothetical protein
MSETTLDDNSDAAGTCDAASDVGECTCGSFASRLGCILSYDGSTQDIVINYCLVALNLACCVAVVLNRHGSDRHRRDDGRRLVLAYHAAASLTFVVVFQIALCFAVGCSGVSIIWCAMCGWIMSERRQRGMSRSSDGIGNVRDDNQGDETASATTRMEKIELGAVLVDVLAIVYYAVTFPIISTVAHICALVLGAGLSLLSIKVSGRRACNGIGNAAPDRTPSCGSNE